MPATPWTDQRTPALAIVARGDQIKAVSLAEYQVRSQSRPDAIYTVRAGKKWSCSCAHHAGTGRDCIHVLAAKFRNDLQQEVSREVAEKPVCDRCRSPKVVLDGKRHGKNGEPQTYLCRTCGHRFTGDDGFLKRRSEPKTIALALDLYFRGLSVRKVADHLAQAYGLKVGHATVYRWVVHYSRLAAEWMDAQGIQTGSRWHMDETVVKVDGDLRYLWNVLDADSRFLLATHVSGNRDLGNTRAPIKKAKAVASQRPTEVFTDGMMAYPDAIGKELGHKQTGEGVGGSWFNPHRRVPSIRAPESNNRIERMHGSQKERTKIMRGFDTDTGAATLAEGWRVHYNMVRDHQTLGTTPAEAAGLPEVVGFRWLKVLQEASREVKQPSEGGENPAT